MSRKRGRVEKSPKAKNDSAAKIGFEAKLWAAADALRNNMDAAEYKHVVLGLIFLNTPTHVVRVLVEMLASYKGRVYDPCCGSGGMFVQSEKWQCSSRRRRCPGPGPPVKGI